MGLANTFIKYQLPSLSLLLVFSIHHTHSHRHIYLLFHHFLQLIVSQTSHGIFCSHKRTDLGIAQKGQQFMK